MAIWLPAFLRGPAAGSPALSEKLPSRDDFLHQHASEVQSSLVVIDDVNVEPASVCRENPFDILPDAPGADTRLPIFSDQDAIDGNGVPPSIVEELGRKYVQAIQDPGSLYEHGNLQQAAESIETLPRTPAELAAHIPQHVSLEDLVTGRLGIENLLEQFGQLQWQSPSSVSDGDILHLFAQGIARPARRASLPALTQREHHAFSPDSAYRAAHNPGRQVQPAACK